MRRRIWGLLRSSALEEGETALIETDPRTRSEDAMQAGRFFFLDKTLMEVLHSKVFT